MFLILPYHHHHSALPTVAVVTTKLLWIAVSTNELEIFHLERDFWLSRYRCSGQPQSQLCRGAWRILQDASNNKRRQLNGLQESVVALA